MIYYLSGPMRGKPKHNQALFCEVEQALYCELNEDGGLHEIKISNPAMNFGGDQTLEPNVYMMIDLHQVLDADVIVLLPEWRESEGARREIQLAIWAGKVFYEATRVGSDLARWRFAPIDLAAPDEESTRASVLDKAKALITGDRNNAYGPPHQDFRRSADAMTAFGYRHTQLSAGDPDCPTCGARPMMSHDTAITVDCIKTSRIMWAWTREDSWVDKAGYAGCGYECALFDAAERQAV